MTEMVEVYGEPDTKQALTLVEQALTLKIRNKNDFDLALNILSSLENFRKEREAYWEPNLTAAKINLQEVKDKIKAEFQIIDPPINYLRNGRAEYKSSQDVIQKRLQAEAEAKAKAAADKEQQRLLEKAVNAKTSEKQEALLEKAENVYPNPVFVEPYIDKTVALDGGGKSTWITDIEIRVTDPYLICKAIVEKLLPITILGEFRHLKTIIKANGIKPNQIPGLYIKEIQREQIKA